MRISTKLAHKFKEFFKVNAPHGSKLYLFGSRVNDSKKGGDIDLLLIVASELQVQELKKQALSYSVQLREIAGDQKVDLLIANPEKLKSDPFLKTIKDKVEL